MTDSTNGTHERASDQVDSDQVDARPKLAELEAAATLLLDLLPNQIRDLSIELADLQYHCPRWHIVAGAVLRLSEEGRLADFSTEPHWSSDVVEVEPTKCGFCELEFTPARVGQKFCCEDCGGSFTLSGGKTKPQLEAEDEHTTDDLTPQPSDESSTPSDSERPDPSPTSIEEILRRSAEISLEEITT